MADLHYAVIRPIRAFPAYRIRGRCFMVETRIAICHRVLKAAKIEFGGDAIDCTVRNLSTTGAAPEGSSQIGVPAKLKLVIPGDALHLPCAIVWRTEYRIGVHFE
jgi:hypothetical protein